ncbi:MAG: hemerythrin domain-containing protein [Candidatus Bathyarchaeota archaeon]|nr:hemerythrin domain-containing protein [Candidatus Bathyarchaeota archaeon]
MEEAHPINILKAEHEIILDNLKTLEKAVKRIKLNKSLDQLNEELKRLEPIAKLLLEAESHHQRGEKALFLRLEELGVTGPPNVMRIEREDLRARKKALKKILDERGTLDPSYVVKRVRELGNYIVSVLGDHIYKENNIIYPLALRIIPENEWGKIREEFDAIGYCCFTPKARAQAEHHHH